MSEVAIIQKFIHTSPRKMRLVADMVKKMSPQKSVDVLHFTQKDAAVDMAHAIKAAISSAKQKGLEADNLSFKSIEVNEGPRLKRFRAGTRGRAKPYKRRMSHVKIVLSDELQIMNDKLQKNKTGKEEVQKTDAK